MVTSTTTIAGRMPRSIKVIHPLTAERLPPCPRCATAPLLNEVACSPENNTLANFQQWLILPQRSKAGWNTYYRDVVQLIRARFKQEKLKIVEVGTACARSDPSCLHLLTAAACGRRRQQRHTAHAAAG